MTHDSGPAMPFNPGMMPQRRTLPPPPIEGELSVLPDFDAVFGDSDAVQAIRRQLNGGNPDQLGRKPRTWRQK